MPPKPTLRAYMVLNCPSICAFVRPSLTHVRSISQILFEVEILNLVCGYTFGSWSVTYYLRVTVTLISGLNSRKSCLWGRLSHSETFLFMPPKELWEAYSNRTVCPSVRPSVRQSVRPAFVSGPYLLYSLR